MTKLDPRLKSGNLYFFKNGCIIFSVTKLEERSETLEGCAAIQ